MAAITPIKVPIVFDLDEARGQLKGFVDEVNRLRAIVDSPDPGDFFLASLHEAKFQRVKWPGPQGFDPSAFGSTEDQDYIFLAAYLCGGAAKTPDGAPGSPERRKKLHRITAAAAAMANWHEEVRNRP